MLHHNYLGSLLFTVLFTRNYLGLSVNAFGIKSGKLQSIRSNSNPWIWYERVGAIVFDSVTANYDHNTTDTEIKGRTNDNSQSVHRIVATKSKIISPRLWLESLPVGAYTVIRCDYDNIDYASDNHNQQSHNKGHWKIWGRTFHLQRLYNSSISLLHRLRLPADIERMEQWNRTLQKAYSTTIAMMDQLEQFTFNNFTQQSFDNAQHDNRCTKTVMLTILWNIVTIPSSNRDEQFCYIRVRCHATPVSNSTNIPSLYYSTSSHTSNDRFVPEWFMPAWNLVVHVNNAVQPSDKHLLQRSNPYAKVSSWCNDRKPLESIYISDPCLLCTNEILTNDDNMVTIHEVILTQQILSSMSESKLPRSFPQQLLPYSNIQLLEGLTSNLFVVYPNHVIRTTATNVLLGYVRHLIVQLIEKENKTLFRHPYTIDAVTPIRLLEDVNEWQEVFCTSSIRLIVPVSKIYIPVFETHTATTCISDSRSTQPTTKVQEIYRCKINPDEQIWRKLLHIILTTTSGSADNG